jgi:hypothetical protein
MKMQILTPVIEPVPNQSGYFPATGFVDTHSGEPYVFNVNVYAEDSEYSDYMAHTDSFIVLPLSYYHEINGRQSSIQIVYEVVVREKQWTVLETPSSRRAAIDRAAFLNGWNKTDKYFARARKVITYSEVEDL